MSSGWAARRPSAAGLPGDPAELIARVYGDLPPLETPRLILRQQMFVKGQYDDLKLYALLRSDHEAQRRTSASQMAGTG